MSLVRKSLFSQRPRPPSGEAHMYQWRCLGPCSSASPPECWSIYFSEILSCRRPTAVLQLTTGLEFVYDSCASVLWEGLVNGHMQSRIRPHYHKAAQQHKVRHAACLTRDVTRPCDATPHKRLLVTMSCSKDYPTSLSRRITRWNSCSITCTSISPRNPLPGLPLGFLHHKEISSGS